MGDSCPEPEEVVTLSVAEVFRKFADMLEDKEAMTRANTDQGVKHLKTLIQMTRAFVHGPMGLSDDVWKTS